MIDRFLKSFAYNCVLIQFHLKSDVLWEKSELDGWNRTINPILWCERNFHWISLRLFIFHQRSRKKHVLRALCVWNCLISTDKRMIHTKWCRFALLICLVDSRSKWAWTVNSELSGQKWCFSMFWWRAFCKMLNWLIWNKIQTSKTNKQMNRRKKNGIEHRKMGNSIAQNKSEYTQKQSHFDVERTTHVTTKWSIVYFKSNGV